jgi:Protein of unknown function (DUF1552)
MIITRKHLSRRTFLRGAGTLIGLPLLDAMAPALGWARGAAATPPLRLCYVYVPNGMVMANFTPATTGSNFAFTPILKPLERFRESTLVLSGMMCHNANPLGDGPGDHARASASFLTGAHPRESGSDIYAGISADQVAASVIGQQTRMRSLELGLEDTRMVGLCDAKYSCAYTSSISWRTPTTPLAPLTNPRHVFERLFGQVDPSLDAATSARRARYRHSILDGAIGDTQRLTSAVSPADRRRIEEYLTSIREVERSIDQFQRAGASPRPGMERPSGTPADYAEHARLMFDLLVLAFQADQTRVSTMMIGRESSIRSYDQIGIPESHHQLSHHRNDPATLAKLTRIQTYHMGLFAQFIARLHATRDGDRSLLDHCAIVYGAGISDSNRHTHERLPMLVLGKANGTLRTGRHIDYGRDTPVTNLHLALLDRLNVRPGRLGDSTGLLEI